MKILFVGGTFNEQGGKGSSVVLKFKNELINTESVTLYNGGYYDSLKGIIDKISNYEIVIWWADVPNNLEKICNIKERFPKIMLITSKRNIENKYNFQDLLERALKTKSNLCIEFTKKDNYYNFLLFDPLGNAFYDGNNIKECAISLITRIKFLKSITRQSTCQAEENIGALSWYFNSFKQEMLKKEGPIEKPSQENFIKLVKEYANIFAKTMFKTEDTERFLGNASFRCPKGFPSFRTGKYIYVSKRNVNKQYIGIEEFIPTFIENEKIYYFGDSKPSVDTPIQLKLYEKLKNINYMIHSHCYIEAAPFTDKIIPCGAIEEVEEILDVIEREYKNNNKNFYVINLKGHGSIMMSNDIEKLKNIKMTGRVLPEK